MFDYSITRYGNNGELQSLTKEHKMMEVQQVYHPNNKCKLWTYFWESEEPSKMVWDYQLTFIDFKEGIVQCIDSNDSAYYSFSIQTPSLKYSGKYNVHGHQGNIYTLGVGKSVTIYTSKDYSSKANLGINYGHPADIGAIVRVIVNIGNSQIVFQLIRVGKSSSNEKELTWKKNKIQKNAMDKLLIISWLVTYFDF